ncbi:hypothetical protein H4R22_002214 [Coemansia sp. RSA 1290]|nr:hypothetical protein H4R22_002214 [Coemansia sp. RSA 1290]
MSYIQSDLITDVINERNIIAFKDYVIDMENYSGGFRKGEPADFVTISLNYEIDSVPESRELELQSLINKILPNDKLKDYFLYHLASCLSYGNLDKVFVIWSGIGSNGKSVMEALVEHTFGGYCYKAPTSLFSSRRTQSSNATPEMANLNKYLLSFIQESDEREVANIGTLKELTEEDYLNVMMLTLLLMN